MKKTIAFTLSLLLLTAALGGCGGRGNVSDNENGKITEDTSRTEATLPTVTRAPTESTTEREPARTEPTTESTMPSATESTGGIGSSENSGTTDSDTETTAPAGRSRSGHRSGIMGGNGRF